jgi:hypothetical protein
VWLAEVGIFVKSEAALSPGVLRGSSGRLAGRRLPANTRCAPTLSLPNNTATTCSPNTVNATCPKALSLYRRIGLVSDEAVCLSSLGHLARVDGRLELALSLQLEAARVFEAHHRPADLAIVRYQLAATSLYLGCWADAKRYAELATGTDPDPALALSVALAHLDDEAGADRERRGFVDRQDR